MVLDVLVLCGGKSGGSTLYQTFKNNNYETDHFHTITIKGLCGNLNSNKNCIELINETIINGKKIIIIDSFRNIIERNISSFFQNISLNIQDYKEKNIDELIKKFNNEYLFKKNEINSINELFSYYNIPTFKKFDFEKKYNIIEIENKIFVKIRFNDIKNWDKILSEILKKNIIIFNQNLTAEKDTYDLYQDFLQNYKIPKEFLYNYLLKDIDFKIYNSEEEQIEYFNYWLNKSI